VFESDFYIYMLGYLQWSENDSRARSSQVLYISTTIFGLLGSFKNTRLKWQILPLVWVVQRQNAFSFRGGFSPDSLTRGLCPWTSLTALPQTRYRLALRARHECYSRLLSTPLFSTWRRPWRYRYQMCTGRKFLAWPAILRPFRVPARPSPQPALISRHSTEARATVRLCRIKEKCHETDLKCVNGWSSSTVQWKRVPKSRSSNWETTSSSVQIVRRNWQKLLCGWSQQLADRSGAALQGGGGHRGALAPKAPPPSGNACPPSENFGIFSSGMAIGHMTMFHSI